MFLFFSAINSVDDSLLVEKLYAQYNSRMTSKANDILKDREAAEDASHTAFVKVIEHLQKIDEKNRLKTIAFLFTICERVALDMLKERTYSNEKIRMAEELEELRNSGNDPIAEMVISKESVDILRSEVKKLKKIYRDVITFKYGYNHSNNEIADLLRISVSAVDKRLARAKKILEKSLAKEELV